MKKKILLLFVILITGLLLSTQALASDLAIVVNKSNVIDSISSNELKKIFLGKKSRWENGEKIRLFCQQVGDVHKAFTKSFVKKSPQQFYTYWNKILFTGKGRPPMELKNDTEMLKFVAADQNAIGYISRDSLNEDVKEISIQ